jgi:hypothetical protein
MLGRFIRRVVQAELVKSEPISEQTGKLLQLSKKVKLKMALPKKTSYRF